MVWDILTLSGMRVMISVLELIQRLCRIRQYGHSPRKKGRYDYTKGHVRCVIILIYCESIFLRHVKPLKVLAGSPLCRSYHAKE